MRDAGLDASGLEIEVAGADFQGRKERTPNRRSLRGCGSLSHDPPGSSSIEGARRDTEVPGSCAIIPGSRFAANCREPWFGNELSLATLSCSIRP